MSLVHFDWPALVTCRSAGRVHQCVCVERGAHRRERGLMTEICARAMWQALKDPYTPLTMVPVTAAVPPNLERGPGVRRPKVSLQGSGHVKSICISLNRRDALAHKHKHTSGAFRIRHACQRSKVTASRNTRLSARTIHEQDRTHSLHTHSLHRHSLHSHSLHTHSLHTPHNTHHTTHTHTLTTHTRYTTHSLHTQHLTTHTLHTHTPTHSLHHTRYTHTHYTHTPHTHTHTLTTHTHTHTTHSTHTRYHTHTRCFLWFTGTFHRRNGFYTVQTVCAIALHLPYT